MHSLSARNAFFQFISGSLLKTLAPPITPLAFANLFILGLLKLSISVNASNLGLRTIVVVPFTRYEVIDFWSAMAIDTMGLTTHNGMHGGEALLADLVFNKVSFSRMFSIYAFGFPMS